MRESDFRRSLAARLGGPSIESYVAYCRRIERELKIDLDADDLNPVVLDTIESRLRLAGLPTASVNNCMSALRSYSLLPAEPGVRAAKLSSRVGMQITPEQRANWKATTAESPFNQWLNDQIRGSDGQMDLAKLHALARTYGIDRESQYAHLNPGQQRMNIGNSLRPIVPTSAYDEVPKTADRVDAEPRQNPAAVLEEPAERDRDLPNDVPFSSGNPAFEGQSVADLLSTYGAIMDELRHRKIVRTGNSPVGDYAEVLFARAFGWTLEANSASGHDATDQQGMRYQIKGRRLSRPGASRQLSAIRRLNDNTFDVLAAVLFDPSFKVARAILVPHSIVAAWARRTEHTNSWTFILDDRVWMGPGVQDVTAELAVAASLI